MARRGKIPQEQKSLLGQKARFIGNGVKRSCAFSQCTNTFSKGMVSKYKEKLYCSESCIIKDISNAG